MVTCKEMYACRLDRFHNVMELNGTAGGRVPYFRMPRVGVSVGCPAAKVAVAGMLGFDGAFVEVGKVAVKFGVNGDAVAVAVTSAAVVVSTMEVTVGLDRTGVSVGGSVAEGGVRVEEA